jgi:hypothetical protein
MMDLHNVQNLNIENHDAVLKGLRELRQVAERYIEADFISVTFISIAMLVSTYKLRVLQQASEHVPALIIAPIVFIDLLIYFLGPYTKLKDSLRLFYKLSPNDFEAVVRMIGVDKLLLISISILIGIGVEGYFMGSPYSVVLLGISFAWFSVLVLILSAARMVFLLRLRDMFNSTPLNVAGTITIVPLATLLIPGLYSLAMLTLGLYTAVGVAVSVATSLLVYFIIDISVWILVHVEASTLESKIEKLLKSSDKREATKNIGCTGSVTIPPL